MASFRQKNGFKKIGIITKHNLKAMMPCLKMLVPELKKYEKEILFDGNCCHAFGKKKGLEKSEIMRKADMVVVLGGDGTLLKVARSVSTKKVPVLGVNMGNVGFLTETTVKGLPGILKKIFSGHYSVDERFLLRVTMYRNGKKYFTSLAFNDAVINQGGFARLIQLRVEVNQRKLALYNADGLIISTPTGSTGHSLSAGGPIIHPKIDGMLLTPLCAVKLGFRPILIPNSRQISIHLETEWRAQKKPIVLTLDGQETLNLKLGDTVRIRKSSRVFQMLRAPGHKYYQMLRRKLNWGA